MYTNRSDPPAQAGDEIVLCGIGFGPVTPNLPDDFGSVPV